MCVCGAPQYRVRTGIAQAEQEAGLCGPPATSRAEGLIRSSSSELSA
eukprot:CAMPEP_0198358480 /NCGR_PEP_ID=MMETSP1450-20131203/130887_1 /TAXON_ID=753684 ORGANISM="Madagascaria erythrocladiodes, Strain CCMP3234" /NCGR_SAMPLE_ID=MMETSP1450 /ASSEMBLY_ACC=CAM_ASM_001115 /LENGTH=46 /DNA_ID= /DNA_START= /DNA_END= /DNA_ORIENTATION=